MCLGVPGQIIAVVEKQATIDVWGVQKRVRLDHLTEPAGPGDYIIEHGGYAVRVIPPQDVPDTLGLYEILLGECDVEVEEPALA